MTTMTLRGIDEPLAKTLKELAHAQGVSLNTLALRLIREATGVSKRKRTLEYHDLDSLAGTWSPEDDMVFRAATLPLETIDHEMWQ